MHGCAPAKPQRPSGDRVNTGRSDTLHLAFDLAVETLSETLNRRDRIKECPQIKLAEHMRKAARAL